MKGEVKRLNKELDEFASNIPVDELNKIYYKKALDHLKTLWLDKDYESFETKTKKITKFLERIDVNKRRSYLLEERKAFNQVCYELTTMIRSEQILFMSSMYNDTWFVNRVNDYLVSYDKTGNKEDFKKVMDFVSRINKESNTINTPEKLLTIERFVKDMRRNEDLTKQDIDCLNILDEYLENYRLHNPVKED